MKMTIRQFAKKYHGIDLPKHQVTWVRFLDNGGKRCILLAPRGHGKTTIINEVYLSWMIANDPTINILLVSHSREMAESFSRSVRAIFERKDIQEDFNIEPGSPWRANSWALKSSRASKPTVRVVGVMGKMTGWRGDVIIFDDLLEITSISSERIRKKIKNWINTAVLNALNPGKERVIVIGTRKHIDDWYGELLINPDYKHRVDKAIRANGTVLWPEMYPKEWLLAKKREIGALKFAQEYQNEPSPPEGMTFPYTWLQFFELLPTTGLKYYMGIDPSHGSTSKTSTYFALCVVAHDTNRDKIYVVDFYRGKHSPEEQVIIASKYADKYAIDAMYIESVFAYTYVYDRMRQRYHNVYDIDYIHTKIKGTTAVHKEERITNICGPAIELGKVLFKRPDLDPYTKMFVEDEYISFPLGDTDMLDALTLAIHHLVGARRITQVPFFFP